MTLRQIYRSFALLLLGLAASATFTACNDTETYSDKKAKERKAIEAYISAHDIKVISEEDFEAAGQVTDTAKNEYVLFASSGVYMQIRRKGTGQKLENGETAKVLCRFKEWNLLTNPDTVQLTNDILAYTTVPDEMTVTNTYGTFTASWIAGKSLMYSVYGASGGTAVPSGWLEPFRYIGLGRLTGPQDEIAKVRLIVPHTRGQSAASSAVYPCLYEISYQRAR